MGLLHMDWCFWSTALDVFVLRNSLLLVLRLIFLLLIG